MAETIKPVPTSVEQFITAEEKIAGMMALDIMLVKEDLRENKYDLLIEILSGDYWTQYANMCSEQFDAEFIRLVEKFDGVQKFPENYVEVLTYLWQNRANKFAYIEERRRGAR